MHTPTTTATTISSPPTHGCARLLLGAEVGQVDVEAFQGGDEAVYVAPECDRLAQFGSGWVGSGLSGWPRWQTNSGTKNSDVRRSGFRSETVQ